MGMDFARAAAMLAALGAASCAPGDWGLGKADLVARANGLWITETAQNPIPYRGSAAYPLSCLSGTRIRAGEARIAAVSGTWNAPGDFRLVSSVQPERNRIVATVTHVGERHDGNAPRVVVELKALCQGPAVD